MISHFDNMITITKVRVDGAKVRYNELKEEVKSMKEEVIKQNKAKNKKKSKVQHHSTNHESGKSTVEVDVPATTVVVDINDDSDSDSDSDDNDSCTEDDEEIRGMVDDCDIVLHFDGSSSSIGTPVPSGTTNDE